MDTILIALTNKVNAKMLAASLSPYYKVISVSQEDDLNQSFDLCIIDCPVINKRGKTLLKLKLAAFPMPLPAILLNNRQDNIAITNIHPYLDLILSTPISNAELHDHVKRLLEQRWLSKSLEKQKNQLIQRAQTNLELAIQAANIGFFEWNLNTGTVVFSPEWKQQIGYTDDELPNTLDEWHQRVHPDDYETLFGLIASLTHGDSFRYTTEFRFRHKDNSYRWIQQIACIYRSNAQNDTVPNVLVGVHIDITERRLSENKLRIAAKVFDSKQAIIITDSKGVILDVNSRFCEMSGFDAQDVIGYTPKKWRSNLQGADFYQKMKKMLQNDHYWTGELWNLHKDGTPFKARLSISAVINDIGQITHFICITTDLTEENMLEEKFKQLSFFDPVTGLPNRLSLEVRYTQMVDSLNEKNYSAFLIVDIDQFKIINNSHGHFFGDAALEEFASRISMCIGKNDFLARFGGDEFIVLLHNLDNDESVALHNTEELAQAIRVAIKLPINYAGTEHFATASIGTYVFRCHKTDSLEEIIKRTHIALSRAKKLGHDSIQGFSSEMKDSVAMRASLETDLHRALQRREFVLFYQIQVDQHGIPLGAEILLRWKNPKIGMVSPADFIPLSEDTGLIIPIGDWVLESACHQLKKWQASKLTEHLVLAVNVSPRQFVRPNFIDNVKYILTKTGINPERLKLEITESFLIDDVEKAITKMANLKNLGVSFSLDDFGTGYSSLSYLKRLPLDQIKIDQSFVKSITQSRRDAELVRSIIAMATSLDFHVIAEGVETLQQKDLLSDFACNAFQGYFFSRPVPLEEFEQLLKLPAALSNTQK